MPKRFTETGKWEDPWFRSLAGAHKLVFLYIIDRCNNAGFWEVDMEALSWHTRLAPKHVEGALKELERGLKGAGGWVWVRRFLRHQKNEELNQNNPAHKQIIAQVKEQMTRFCDVPEFQEFLSQNKGLLSPSQGASEPHRYGKGKVKEEDKSDKEEGMQGEEPPKPPKKKRKREPASRCTREELESYAQQRGFPASDGSAFFDMLEANGWKMSRGNPVQDVFAHFRNYQSNGWLVSQKVIRHFSGRDVPQVDPDKKYENGF